MQKKRMLVTGGAGFIGSHFVEEAVRKGHEIVILDAMTYASNTNNLKNTPKENLVLIEGNITDNLLLQSLFKQYNFDIIVNIAAETHVDNSIKSPAIFLETNIIGTYHLLQASLHYYNLLSEEEKSKFRYMQISTDEVFGSLEAEEKKFNETSLIKPNSPYSASKASADHFVRAWHHTYGLPTITTHCSNNYGPRQYHEKLIPLVIECALKEKPIPVYGDGQQIRDWIHVKDHVQGLFLALEKGIPGEIYCFGGEEEINNIALIRGICVLLSEIYPHPAQKKYTEYITFVDDRLGHDRRYAIDNRKAKEELGFHPYYNLKNSLKETVEWNVNSLFERNHK